MSHHNDYEERVCKHCFKAYRERDIDDTGYCSEECQEAAEALKLMIEGTEEDFK